MLMDGVERLFGRGERLLGWRAPRQCGKRSGERVGQGREPGVKARLEDARATGQGLPAVLGAGELGQDRLGSLAECGRLGGVAVVGPAGDQRLGR